jgi:hypothetical protein
MNAHKTLILTNLNCLLLPSWNKVASKRVVRNEEEERWNDEVSSRRAATPSWNTTNHPSCQLTGKLMVDETPGSFVIHANSYGHNVPSNMVNLSHIVHHFSFGDIDTQNSLSDGWFSSPPRFAKSLHPMDGHLYATKELHQAYHHHLQVVTTEIDSTLKKWTRSVSERVYRIIERSHLTSYRRQIVPEAKFSYDLSPIAISYIQTSTDWYDYATSLFAIIGGTFTVLGMMNSGLASFSPKRSSYY